MSGHGRHKLFDRRRVGTGKTSVAEELERRGFQVVHGDRALSYQGDPETGEPLERPDRLSAADAVTWVHKHHIWDVEKVKSLAAEHRRAISFFCGGSRNFRHFIDLFDAVFDKLHRRLAARPGNEFGGKPCERALIAQLHATQEDVPSCGPSIDATAPAARLVDRILLRCREA